LYVEFIIVWTKTILEDTGMVTGAAQDKISFSRPDDNTLLVTLTGAWKIGKALPSTVGVRTAIESGPEVDRIAFDTRGIESWDSSLLTFLIKVTELCTPGGIKPDPTGLPPGVQRLLALAAAVPEQKDARREDVRDPFLMRVGTAAIEFGRSTLEILDFIGDAFLALGKMLRGKAQFRRSDLILLIQECGAQALPIVSLISLLFGLILGFVGAVQLVMFGAEVYVAGLVGIAMVRVMGAVMTGIVMAGRTGAAFAAQLGTMEVNEEIDALRTLGVSPMEFLVLPRMIALALMMPMLGLYADLVGILGGLIVGVGMLDLNLLEYYNMTRSSISLNDFWIGLFSSCVFGVLVAAAGCLRGMQSGRSAAAVGEAATSAVVTGIVCIITATAVITIMCNVIGI
jgi:phospholipid/cholesterol/gamma-HCH transport system permease protein